MTRLERIRARLYFLRRDKIKWLSWPYAAKIGATQTAKLSWVAPFLAHLVVWNEDFVAHYFGLVEPLWLYWSLISFFLAQLIFSLTCPAEIKKYSDRKELYVSEALNQRSDVELAYLDVKLLKSFFSRNGEMQKLKIPEISFPREHIDPKEILESLPGMSDDELLLLYSDVFEKSRHNGYLEVDVNGRKRDASDIFGILFSVLVLQRIVICQESDFDVSKFLQRLIDWEYLRLAHDADLLIELDVEMLPKIEAIQGEPYRALLRLAAYQDFQAYIDSHINSDGWRSSALSAEYERLSFLNWGWIVPVFLLYASGSAYFIVSLVNITKEMISLTVSTLWGA